MSAVGEAEKSLSARLIQYAGERFPLPANGLLTALMCAGSIAPLHLSPPQPLWQAALSFLALLPLFFIMRVADEHKDFADDSAYRPERPVPRGLVTLGELRGAAAVAGVMPLVLAVAFSPLSIVPLLLALAWIGAMSFEFGVKHWLRAHPLAYLFSHMLVMPLLALVAISFAVPDTEAFFSARVAIILGLAFAAGLSLEIGRKVWAPAEEREGVETYSKLWGPATAAIVWLAAASAALILGAVPAGPRLPILLAAGVLILIGATAALRFIGHTDVSRARQLRAVVVLGVAAAYGLSIAGAMLP